MQPENDWPKSLSKLDIPAPSAGFATRIVAEAHPHGVVQKKIFSLADFFAELMIPKPALALAFVLSIFVGWQAGSSTVFGDISANIATTISSANNGAQDSFHFDAGQVL